MASGATVTATISGTVCGQTTVKADSTYALDVVSNGQMAGCGTEGAFVSFQVNGASAGSATWSSGELTELDLAVSVPPTPPNRFQGSVAMDGNPAPPGTNVTATIGGTVCGQTVVKADSTYIVDVVSSEQTAGCGTEGALVSFTVAGYPAGLGIWSSGAFIDLDLAAATAAPPPSPPESPPPVSAPVEPPVSPPPSPPGGVLASPPAG